MGTKNLAYDHPAYINRLSHNFGMNAAGAGSATQFSKFVAFANIIAFSVTAAVSAVGTSTYTQYNGTATTTGVAADSFSVIRVLNGTAVSTLTYGPFSVGPYNGTSTGTQTNTVGVVNRYELSNGTSTATTGQIQAGAPALTSGGIPVNAGDTLQIVRGTDATAVTVFGLEWALAPNANVSS